MLRWNDVSTTTIDGMTVKMYRPVYVPEETRKIKAEKLDLDHYAYINLGSEGYMYKILDINWTGVMENRGDVSRLEYIYVPNKE